ncbi:hypothetical protein L2E82_31810 [Cichorium intybus]|uniref:Uncharacterized protein n=1 Tax=Cichorium intybus TaxID=13427 RepID=A0ACB9BF34_CICIN|nr:hypothetical protein L2E82_31810 [Cichorium intybus]
MAIPWSTYMDVSCSPSIWLLYICRAQLFLYMLRIIRDKYLCTDHVSVRIMHVPNMATSQPPCLYSCTVAHHAVGFYFGLSPTRKGPYLLAHIRKFYSAACNRDQLDSY